MATTNTYVNAYLEGLLAHCNVHGWQDCRPGTKAALRAYDQTDGIGLGTLAVRDMPRTVDMPDFMDCLALADVTEFLLCDRSSGLMDALHYLLAEGWQVCGAYDSLDDGASLLGLLMRKPLRLRWVGEIEDYFRTYYEDQATGNVYALTDFRGVRAWNTATPEGEPDMPLQDGLRIEIVEDGRVISREAISRLNDCASIGLTVERRRAHEKAG
jgi:hypothetical protein